jgi:multicomponent Na+:H+ antiporter subunit D
MLLSSFVLLTLGGERAQLEGAIKYVTLNLLSSILFLAVIGLIYATCGTLNLAHLAVRLDEPDPATATALGAPLLIAFGIKAAVFPVFFWLPASSHTPPPVVSALFAGLLTKVGVYAVLRTVGDVFSPAPELILEALGWVAAATMLLGVLGAAYHWDMRRILAFHIVSQIGYILLAIALSGEAGNAATLFYTVHHIIVKANLFLIAAIIWRLTGSYDLRRIGGLYRLRPALGVLFMIPAVSLVGMPPLSGFWAKLLVLQEALAQGRYVWTAVALGVSVLTLYSMVKIWMEAFWKPHPDDHWQPPRDTRLGAAWGATLGLAALTLAISLNPEPLLAYAQAAARTLGGMSP